MARRGKPLAELSDRHETFILEYLRDRNGSRAYVAAGYSAANPKQEAWALLRDPLVAGKIAALTAEKFKALHMDVDEILARTAMIARSDLAALIGPDGRFLPLEQLDETATAGLASIEHEETFEGKGKDRKATGVTRKVRLRDPIPALRLLAEHKKLVKTPDQGVNALANMLAERMRAARERAKKEPSP